MIPPPPLRELLAEAEKEMAHNPQLELPYKIDTDICSTVKGGGPFSFTTRPFPPYGGNQ